LRHVAGKQFHILRQIADVPAEPFRRPLVERGAVERNAAAYRPPDAAQQAGE
jgi:hypothetical protein